MDLPRQQLGKMGLVLIFGILVSGVGHAATLHWTDRLPQPLLSEDFPPTSVEKTRLGQAFFYDKVLSGNQNIACATCHHPNMNSADGLSLGVGEGGQGLGTDRTTGAGSTHVSQRVPRHSPALFNLGANQIHSLFHDGRVQKDLSQPSGYKSPAAAELPNGLDSVLAVQALFPMTSDVEMAGTAKENEIGAACEAGITYGWQAIVNRVKAIPGYEPLYLAAYPDATSLEELTIVDIGNALGAFVAAEWRSDASPFDAYVKGDKSALSQEQVSGAEIFYGEGDCASCHSGTLLTDQRFHAIGIPQFGPGTNEVSQSVGRDLGRYNETIRESDRYRFRTPSLRNVSETAPYGHTGAYTSLEGVVRHHLNPKAALQAFSTEDAVLPKDQELGQLDFLLLADEDELIRIATASDISEISLSDTQISDLVAFLEGLTDPASLKGRLGVPESVPSGLPVN